MGESGWGSRHRERAPARRGRTAVVVAVAGMALFTPLPAAAEEADPLAGLRVEPEGARAGYDRELFPHWSDVDGDGCSTRHEILMAESLSPAQVDPYGCRVVAGDWLSVYDGIRVSDPAELEVDRVVALAEAWDSGAAGWTTARRERFANDLDRPGALAGVASASNQAKADSDPAQWRPMRGEAWCGFA